MSSHYKGSTSEQLALSALINLSRASNSVISRLEQSISASSGLTTPQFGVLEALFHLGPLCQKDLAEKLLCTSGNLTAVIDNLIKQELVERVADTNDRRRHFITLTKKGTELIAKIFPQHAAEVQQIFSSLSKAEQDTLRVLCRKLGSGLQTN